jgi:Fe-S cluster biogenesis protein NfuA
MSTMTSGEFQAHAEKLEQLVEQANALPDENGRTTALELMQSLMDLHGAAVSRIVKVLSDCGEAGRDALARIAADPMVCGLLVLYGIHPVALEERLARAIDHLGPQLQKLGATLELLGAADGAVRVKVHSTRGDHQSAETMRDTIERTIREAAPEVAEIAIEGLQARGFVPLNMIQPAMKGEKQYEESTA